MVKLSHRSKTTPVSKNERNTRNENFFRSETVVAQSHVRQADDALVAVSNGSHYAKAWCYCGSSTHPRSIQRGTLEERRGANVEPARKQSTQVICSRRYGNGSRRHGSHGKKADHGYVGVEQCERRQGSSLLRIGSSRFVTKVPVSGEAVFSPVRKNTGHVPKEAHITSNDFMAYASATAPSFEMAFPPRSKYSMV